MIAGAEELLPVFLKLRGRRVLVVGGGAVAVAKLPSLLAAGAEVRVVAPEVRPELRLAGVAILRRPFVARDLAGVWYVLAAAPRAVNAEVVRLAEARRLFVNAVDDSAHASAYAAAVVRKAGVTFAISTAGSAPALAGLLREALTLALPEELDAWVAAARRLRRRWRRSATPMARRRPLLLEELNRIYTQRERAS